MKWAERQMLPNVKGKVFIIQLQSNSDNYIQSTLTLPDNKNFYDWKWRCDKSLDQRKLPVVEQNPLSRIGRIFNWMFLLICPNIHCQTRTLEHFLSYYMEFIDQLERASEFLVSQYHGAQSCPGNCMMHPPPTHNNFYWLL